MYYTTISGSPRARRVLPKWVARWGDGIRDVLTAPLYPTRCRVAKSAEKQ